MAVLKALKEGGVALGQMNVFVLKEYSPDLYRAIRIIG